MSKISKILFNEILPGPCSFLTMRVLHSPNWLAWPHCEGTLIVLVVAYELLVRIGWQYFMISQFVASKYFSAFRYCWFYNFILQEKGLADYSFCGPPLLNEQSGSAIGLKVRKSNVVASLAQFVSGLGMQPDSAGLMHCFSTFGQVMCQLSGSTKLSLLGIHRVPKMSNQQVSLGPMAIPTGMFKHDKHPEISVETSSPLIGTNREENILSGSIAMVLESELDESTRIGGWVR